MKRVVTVWWPDWPVVAAGASAGPAIVLRANRVVARSPSAAAEGVAIGQRRRIAQQRCPEAVILDHDPARDARAFEPVVRAVAAFTPRIEQVEPGWLSLDARGPSRYFGGDEAFAARVAVAAIDAVGPMRAGTGVGVGIADGCFAAAVAARRAAGRGGRPVIVPAGATPGFLAPLPVAWLHELGEADPELVGLFARMGLARLGDVAGLDGGDVLARFGPPGRHAHHLAAGTDERAPGGTEPAPERRVERTFDDPVTNVAPLVFVAKQLADELVATLGAEGRVCTRLVVMAETEHGERSERVWYRAAGLSVPAMVERVRWQLDGWAAGIGEMDEGAAGRITGGITVLRLEPEEVRGDDGDQLGLWGGRSDADERAARAVTRLVGLAGDEAVLVPAWQGGRLPGDRYTWVPASTTDLADPDDTAERVRPRLDEPWPGALPAPSPAVVLPAARPAELVDATGAPVRVSGRGELSAPPAALAVEGGPAVAVSAWAGPWPLEERWWDPGRHRRLARFQIVTADGTAHLVVAEHRRWWVAANYE